MCNGLSNPLRERGPASGYGRSFTLDCRWSFENISSDEGRWRLGVWVTGDGRYHVLTSLAEIDRDMQVLLEHLDRLKRVSRGLLLLAKVDAGQLPKASERFDLASLCRDLCDDAKTLATDTDLQAFAINLPDSLSLQSDPVLVRTIVFNLLVNAVHYSDRPIAIRVELKSDAEWIFLNIANKAPLIPEADQARLFDRFYRGSTRRIISDKDEAGSGQGQRKGERQLYGQRKGPQDGSGKRHGGGLRDGSGPCSLHIIHSVQLMVLFLARC